jgi:hypothetical protein
MNKIGEVVEVNLPEKRPLRSPNIPISKKQIGAKIKNGDRELIVYNGIDKYVLYILLQELMKNDSEL